MATVTTRSYDIFAGTKDAAPMWLEAADNRESAYEKMLEYSLNKPGRYFVFSPTTNTVICTVDTTIVARMAEHKA